MAGLVTSHPPAPTSHLQTPTSHLPPPTKLSPPTHQTKSLSYQPLSQCIAHCTNVRSLKLQCFAQMCPMLHCHVKNLSLQCIAHCTKCHAGPMSYMTEASNYNVLHTAMSYTEACHSTIALLGYFSVYYTQVNVI